MRTPIWTANAIGMKPPSLATTTMLFVAMSLPFFAIFHNCVRRNAAVLNAGHRARGLRISVGSTMLGGMIMMLQVMATTLVDVSVVNVYRI